MKKTTMAWRLAMLAALLGGHAGSFAATPATPATPAAAPAEMAKANPNELVAHAVETVVKAAKNDSAAAAGDVNATTRVVQREFLPYTDFRRTTLSGYRGAWEYRDAGAAAATVRTVPIITGSCLCPATDADPRPEAELQFRPGRHQQQGGRRHR